MANVNFNSSSPVLRETTSYQVVNENDTIWRFMPMDKFLMLLSNQSLWFAKWSAFDDQLEGTVPSHWVDRTKGYSVGLSAGYISCWSRGEAEPVHMWKLYGGDSLSVCIKSSAGALKQTLKGANTPSATPFNIDNVAYVDYSDTRITKPRWLTPTDDGKNTSYLVKRHNFQAENELRVFFVDRFTAPTDGSYTRIVIHPDSQLKEETLKLEEISNGYDIQISLQSLIHEVIISPSPSHGIKAMPAIERLLDSYSLNIPVRQSSIFKGIK